jgi:hypothetical protein
MAPQTDVQKLVTEQSGAKGDRARKPYGASHPRSARARPCLQIAGRRPLLPPPRGRLSKNSRMPAYCHVLPEVLDKLRQARYDARMRPRTYSLESGTRKVEQPGGPAAGSALPGPSPASPRGPRGVRAGRQIQPGAAKVGTAKRLTPAAKQTVQMMLAAWALRELAARRTAQSHSRKGKIR